MPDVTPPWRPQDVPDAILQRPSREPVNSVALLAALADVEFDVDATHAMVVWNETPRGLQPVIWPMRLHGREFEA